ncbi:hypothetical protein J0J30_23720, partial [Vibrio vulnificus]|nr:hypothetical protein [Vibrio vulnificus]
MKNKNFTFISVPYLCSENINGAPLSKYCFSAREMFQHGGITANSCFFVQDRPYLRYRHSKQASC